MIGDFLWTRKADPAFLAFQNKVFARDHFTCQFCAFEANQHMETINVDGNYLNNRLSNLLTACPFCTQCFFLQAIGQSDHTGGTLIYLPEMSQIELNALCHALFSALVMGSSFATDAKNIYRSLRLRSQVIEKELGNGLSNPALYGQLLIDVDSDVAESLHAELKKTIRVLPSLKVFADTLLSWADAATSSLAL